MESVALHFEDGHASPAAQDMTVIETRLLAQMRYVKDEFIPVEVA
jgi:hypothetical protein